MWYIFIDLKGKNRVTINHLNAQNLEWEAFFFSGISAGSSASGVSSVVPLLCTPEHPRIETERQFLCILPNTVVSLCLSVVRLHCRRAQGTEDGLSCQSFCSVHSPLQGPVGKHSPPNTIVWMGCKRLVVQTAPLPFTNLAVINEEWDCGINRLLKVVVECKLCCAVPLLCVLSAVNFMHVSKLLKLLYGPQSKLRAEGPSFWFHLL